MFININLGKSILNKVNSKGYSLLRKDVGIKVEKAVQDSLKCPEGAVTYDAVRVGKINDAAEVYTDIFTFRDKEGNVVNRYIKKVDGEDITVTKKKYEKMSDDEVKIDGTDEIKNIFARKVRSFTRKNDKISNITEDVFSVTDDLKPILTHFKRVIDPYLHKKTIWYTPLQETILLEQRQNSQPAKYIKNKFIVKTAYGIFDMIEMVASDKKLEKIAQNTYFLPFVSPSNKFAYRMSWACIKDAKFACPPDVTLYKKPCLRRGEYSTGGHVYLNLMSGNGWITPRDSLTQTIGHEVAHAKWDEKVGALDFYEAGIYSKKDFLKMYSLEEIPLIKKYREAILNYVWPEENKKAYLDNFAEVVARQAGKAASKKYYDLRKNIDREFPYQHIDQFYVAPDFEDDLSSFFNIGKTFS